MTCERCSGTGNLCEHCLLCWPCKTHPNSCYEDCDNCDGTGQLTKPDGRDRALGVKDGE